MSIITTTFQEGPAARNRALSMYSGCAAAGFSLGLVLSGLSPSGAGARRSCSRRRWRCAALAGGLILVPRSPRTRRPGQGYDLLGVVTVTASLLLLMYTLTEAQSGGWASARTVGSFAAVVMLLVVFAVTELRTASPLVRLGILRSRSVLGSNLAGFLFQGSYMGFQFILVLYLQRLLGWSALTTALGILPAGVLVGLVAPRMGAVIDRFGPARLMVTGFCMPVACFANMLRIGPHSSYPGVILPSMLLVGLSFGSGVQDRLACSLIAVPPGMRPARRRYRPAHRARRPARPCTGCGRHCFTCRAINRR